METQNPARPDKAAADHSLLNLLRELRDETSTLVRQEIALAKAETSEKVSRMGRNVGYIGVGGALAYAALILLLLGIRDLLARALTNADLHPIIATALASFIVAIIIGTVGWSLIAKGKKALSEEGLSPQKTIDSLRQDKQLIKQKLAHT